MQVLIKTLTTLVNYNGLIAHNTSFSIESDNRALNYADGFFESILFKNGTSLLWDFHYQRMIAASCILGFNIEPQNFYFEQIKKTLVAAKLDHKIARVRLSLFRNPGGLYRPTSIDSSFIIQVKISRSDLSAISQTGIHLGFAKTIKPIHTLFSFKSLNCAIYIAASQEKQDQNFDELVLINNKGFVCEATSSNIFWIKDEQIFTPKLSDGCVNGTMRKYLLDRSEKSDFSVLEDSVSSSQLMQSDEIFLCNAIQGIIPAKAINGKELESNFTRFFHQQLLG